MGENNFTVYFFSNFFQDFILTNVYLKMKIKIDRNIVDHADCILQMEKLFTKLKNKDDDYIILNKKMKNLMFRIYH